MAGTDDDRKSAEKGPDPEKGPKKKSIGKWIGIGAAAAIGGVGAIIATPVVLGAVGFTSAGIAAGSWAAGMMSSAAIANGGGVAAGSVVAILQSVGAAGLGAAGAAAVGGTGAAAAAGVAAGTAKVIDSVRTDSDGSSQAPRFLNKEKYADGQSLHSGETLEIHFEGHPTPSVNWSQDDGNMEHTPIIKTDDGNGVTSLSVGKVEGVVVIRYTVTLANEVGKDELKVKVVLIGDSPDNAKKPALKSGPSTTHSRKDSGINPTAGGNQSPRFVTQEESLDLPVICSGQAFKIYYEGQPAPSVSWKMDHGSMKNPPSFQTSYGNGVVTLEVGNVSSTGSLCFTVALQNEVGQEEKQFKITVVA